MPEPQITPHRITKPIQLLAAWLAGLAIVNGSFLTAAATIQTPTWILGTLVVASVLNVPLFLFCLFLLQTKFRPEMQEDSYYSQYLQDKYSDTTASFVIENHERPLQKLAADIVEQVSADPNRDQPKQQEMVVELLKESEIDHLATRFSGNRSLSELHMYPNLWGELYKKFGGQSSFKRDTEELLDAELIALPSGTPADAELTSIGEAVAKKLEAENRLWNQNRERTI